MHSRKNKKTLDTQGIHEPLLKIRSRNDAGVLLRSLHSWHTIARPQHTQMHTCGVLGDLHQLPRAQCRLARTGSPSQRVGRHSIVADAACIWVEIRRGIVEDEVRQIISKAKISAHWQVSEVCRRMLPEGEGWTGSAVRWQFGIWRRLLTVVYT